MRTYGFLTILGSLMLGSLSACGDGEPRLSDGAVDAAPDAAPEALTLKTGAPFTAAAVYEAVTFRNPADRSDVREWIPVDVTRGPWGEVWVIQRAQRSGLFDDITECTMRGWASPSPDDDDCIGQIGSTVGISDPTNAEAASRDNGRAILVSDQNAWHFMRRPSGIAFGMPETSIEPGDPGARAPDGSSYITETATFMFPFATCSDAITANFTDEQPFAGPSLWTADPSLYDGNNPEPYSNGSHLDMVHGTQYCTGIAWERDNVYWAINGIADSFDRYDFATPHLPGHSYHGDATITRYQWFDDGPVRVPDVPSNTMIEDGTLYVADSGNGRVIAMAIDATGTPSGTFFSFEGLESDRIADAPLSVVIDEAALSAEWGGAAVPSGLAVLDSETLVIGNNASGHISLVGLDGTVVRTIDTGVGPGMGGITVFDGVIYFVQMTERRLYRIDVEEGVFPEA